MERKEAHDLTKHNKFISKSKRWYDLFNGTCPVCGATPEFIDASSKPTTNKG